MVISPLNAVPKKESEDRRIILDLSFGEFEESVNGHIDKELIRVKGQGCHCFKRDLKRAYRQIPCCPEDWHLVGFSWKNHIF